MFYRLVKLLFWPVGRFYLGMRIEGAVPRKGPLILAANHSSWLDPAVLGSACPRSVRFLVTRRVYDRPFQSWFYRWMGTIPVRDSGDADHVAIRRAVRALRSGQVVGIFPEGVGLDPGGRLRSPRTGAAFIASAARAPVVPVAIQGTHDALPKGRCWPRPGRVRVTFGDPFVVGSAAPRPGRDRRREGADELMRRITRLLERGEEA